MTGLSCNPMRITVRFFAILKDRAGTDHAILDLPDNSTITTALPIIAQRFPMTGGYASIAFAVNQSYASADTVLRNGDELALLPPVSGG